MASPNKGLDPFFKIAAWKENPVTARHADDADVRPEPNDLPFVPAAGVRFAQTNYIVEEKLERHCVGHYSIGINLMNLTKRRS